MLKSIIIKVDRFTSKAGNPCTVAWYSNEDGLPVRDFCPEWCEAGQHVAIKIVPDYRCNSRHEFTLLDD